MPFWPPVMTRARSGTATLPSGSWGWAVWGSESVSGWVSSVDGSVANMAAAASKADIVRKSRCVFIMNVVEGFPR